MWSLRAQPTPARAARQSLRSSHRVSRQRPTWELAGRSTPQLFSQTARCCWRAAIQVRHLIRLARFSTRRPIVFRLQGAWCHRGETTRPRYCPTAKCSSRVASRVRLPLQRTLLQPPSYTTPPRGHLPQRAAWRCLEESTRQRYWPTARSSWLEESITTVSSYRAPKFMTQPRGRSLRRVT